MEVLNRLQFQLRNAEIRGGSNDMVSQRFEVKNNWEKELGSHINLPNA